MKYSQNLEIMKGLCGDYGARKTEGCFLIQYRFGFLVVEVDGRIVVVLWKGKENQIVRSRTWR